MRKIYAFLTLALGALALAVGAMADPGDGNGDGKDKDTHGKFTFNLVTTDFGSCGVNVWATDTVKRTYEVKANGDGTFRLTRRDRGTFVTHAGVSPGACEQKGPHGKTVRAGVTGKVNGSIVGTITGGTFNPKAACTGDTCGTRAGFIAAFFGPNAKYSCDLDSSDCKFNFEYTAAHNQTLRFRHWQDKGKGAGTALHEEFHGDIADA